MDFLSSWSSQRKISQNSPTQILSSGFRRKSPQQLLWPLHADALLLGSTPTLLWCTANLGHKPRIGMSWMWDCGENCGAQSMSSYNMQKCCVGSWFQDFSQILTINVVSTWCHSSLSDRCTVYSFHTVWYQRNGNGPKPHFCAYFEACDNLQVPALLLCIPESHPYLH